MKNLNGFYLELDSDLEIKIMLLKSYEGGFISTIISKRLVKVFVFALQQLKQLCESETNNDMVFLSIS